MKRLSVLTAILFVASFAFPQTKVNGVKQLTIPGINGQLLFNNSGVLGAEDPIVSFNYVNLLTTAAATATASSVAPVRLPRLSATGTVYVTFASITGSPSTCTLQLKNADSLGNLINNGSPVAVTAANGTTTFAFSPAAGLQTAAQLSVTFACVAYPSTGTLTVDFSESSPSSPVTGTLAVTQSTSPWVDSITTWATGTLGAMANYGVSPGSVLVPGVNAFITNTVTVSGTITTTPPSNASTNLAQVNGVALGSPSAYGSSPGAVNVPGVNAFITNTPGVVGTLGNNGGAASTNRVPTLPCVVQTDPANGTAYTQGRDAGPNCGTDGNVWVNIMPALRPASFATSAKFAGSSTTDNSVMPGNATNTVLVTKVMVSCTQTTAGITNLSVVKRSAADTAGTSAGMTAVPDDSTFTAISAPLSYTGTGPSVGAAVGNVDTYQLGCNAAATAGSNDIYILDRRLKPIVLRGVAQQLAINFGGAITGGNLTVTYEWQEVKTITP